MFWLSGPGQASLTALYITFKILTILTDMNCIVIHIHREGNQVADILASHGLSLPSLSHWNAAPLFIIRDILVKNQPGLPILDFVLHDGALVFVLSICNYLLLL
jgi:hypothetical protein